MVGFYRKFGASAHRSSSAILSQLQIADATKSLLKLDAGQHALTIWKNWEPTVCEDGDGGDDGGDDGRDDGGGDEGRKEGREEGGDEGGVEGVDEGGDGRSDQRSDECGRWRTGGGGGENFVKFRAMAIARAESTVSDVVLDISNSELSPNLAELYDQAAELALDTADCDDSRWGAAVGALSSALSTGLAESFSAVIPPPPAKQVASDYHLSLPPSPPPRAEESFCPADAAVLGIGPPLRAMYNEVRQIRRLDENLCSCTLPVEPAQLTAYHVTYPAVAGINAQYSAVTVSAKLRDLLPDLLSAFDDVRDLAEYNHERDVHLLTFGSCHRTGSQQYDAESGSYAVLKPGVALPDDPSGVLTPSAKAGREGLSQAGLSFLARTMGIRWLQEHVSLHNRIYRSAASKNPRLSRMAALLALVGGAMARVAHGRLLDEEEWADLQAGCPEEQRPFLDLPCASKKDPQKNCSHFTPLPCHNHESHVSYNLRAGRSNGGSVRLRGLRRRSQQATPRRQRCYAGSQPVSGDIGGGGSLRSRVIGIV